MDELNLILSQNKHLTIYFIFLCSTTIHDRLRPCNKLGLIYVKAQAQCVIDKNVSDQGRASADPASTDADTDEQQLKPLINRSARRASESLAREKGMLAGLNLVGVVPVP